VKREAKGNILSFNERKSIDTNSMKAQAVLLTVTGQMLSVSIWSNK